MFSNTSDRSGPKKGKDSLRLKKWQESADRQSSAHEEAVEDHQAAAEELPDNELWIDDHFQRVLKKDAAVHAWLPIETFIVSLF